METNACIDEFSICIAPFTVFFIKGPVGFSTDRKIVKGHAAYRDAANFCDFFSGVATNTGSLRLPRKGTGVRLG